MIWSRNLQKTSSANGFVNRSASISAEPTLKQLPRWRTRKSAPPFGSARESENGTWERTKNEMDRGLFLKFDPREWCSSSSNNGNNTELFCVHWRAASVQILSIDLDAAEMSTKRSVSVPRQELLVSICKVFLCHNNRWLVFVTKSSAVARDLYRIHVYDTETDHYHQSEMPGTFKTFTQAADRSNCIYCHNKDTNEVTSLEILSESGFIAPRRTSFQIEDGSEVVAASASHLVVRCQAHPTRRAIYGANTGHLERFLHNANQFSSVAVLSGRRNELFISDMDGCVQAYCLGDPPCV